MKGFKIFLSQSSYLRELLDIYLELRQHLQELGFSESDLENPPLYSKKMMDLQVEFQQKINVLRRTVRDYGFDVDRSEIIDYLEPQLQKINELTPLKDGNSKRDDTGDENY